MDNTEALQRFEAYLKRRYPDRQSAGAIRHRRRRAFGRLTQALTMRCDAVKLIAD